ncbi:MAG: hypothetical protein AABW59_05615 [archaeon]
MATAKKPAAKDKAKNGQVKALLLISGGIDSPVAGKMAQEKGYALEAIHFSQEPFTDDTPRLKSKALCERLGLKEMIVVQAGEELKEIAEKSFREYYFVLMKRFFMMTSEIVAKNIGAKYLITGESLGQVSSQTLSNLTTINQSTEIEIVRPLIFQNKLSITNKSEEWNFFEISKGPEMCDALASGKPKTRTKLSEVLAQEDRCGMKKLVESAAKKAKNESTIGSAKEYLKRIENEGTDKKVCK